MSKSIVLLVALSLTSIATAASVSPRATGGYVQNPSGQASFTMYTGCGQPGKSVRFAQKQTTNH